MGSNHMGPMMSGSMDEMMREMMSGDMMDGTMMRDMQPIHQLLMQHDKINRRVTDIPNGIESWTESDDPEIARLIQTHVRQMKDRVEEGRPIRMMDPLFLFREIFRHHKKIDLQIENTAKGVHVIETSKDPKVVKLIRQHAHEAVSEFVDEGMSRAMKPTELPEGYEK